MEQCDIAIVGAGMVGAATACLLAAEGLNVRVIETRLPEHYAPDQPLDLRVSAISQASVALLTRAGAWQYLQQMRLCPYRRLETWELDGFATRFDAVDLGLPQLGYIIENRLIQLALLKRMEDFPTIQTHTPAAVTSLRQSADDAVLTLDDGTELQARWVLACDGAGSDTRRLLGAEFRGQAFQDRFLIADVVVEPQAADATETAIRGHGATLRRLGCTKLQMGIQSLDERILAANHRGIGVEQQGQVPGRYAEERDQVVLKSQLRDDRRLSR